MRINLVQGQSAGGLLRQACRQFGVPGSVYVIDDDLSVGPLCNDETRDDWWAVVYKATFGEAYQRSVYKQWDALTEFLRVQGNKEIVLWSSDSARDYILDRMAASMLAGYGGTMFHISVPPNGTLSGVAYLPPEQLAVFETTKVRLERDSLAKLAIDFDSGLRSSAGVRCLEDGAIRSLPDSALDQSVLDHCPFDWTKWYHVIGSAMDDCDGHNLISDVFFGWRLHCLVEAGKIELRGTPDFPGNWSNVLVRRSGATRKGAGATPDCV